VIQSYFLDVQRSGAGITARTVNALCGDYRGGSGNPWLLMHCAHGMGHGLTMLHRHHLPRALEGCDLLTSAFEREACYGGAFMENVVNATMPHHPAAAAQAGGHGAHGHGGHGHAGHGVGHGAAADSAAPFRALDPKDLLYPCSAMQERYLPACYAMQTSAILLQNGWDVAGAARECERAPGPHRRTCFISLGRDLSGAAMQDAAESIRRCGRLDPSVQPWCHNGAVSTTVQVTARAEDGFAYCRMVRGADGKRECYDALGKQVLILEPEPARREAACAGAEEGYVEACRAGAGLVPRHATPGISGRRSPPSRAPSPGSTP
jgi:hypothetical protein